MFSSLVLCEDQMRRVSGGGLASAGLEVLLTVQWISLYVMIGGPSAESPRHDFDLHSAAYKHVPVDKSSHLFDLQFLHL